MKKYSSFPLILIFSALLLQSAFAKNYEWNTYPWTPFQFELILPNLVLNTQNQEYETPARYFVASDNVNYTISVYSWLEISDNIKKTEKDIAQTGFKNYSSITEKEILKQKEVIRPDGLKYETLYGIGQAYGKSVYFYIAGFVIPKNGAMVYTYVTFAWWDLPNYNSFHQKISDEILQKLRILPPPQKVNEGD